MSIAKCSLIPTAKVHLDGTEIHSRPMAGRTLLITDGTGGIGRATALGLATMGAHLAITGRDRGRTEGAAREIRAAGGGQVTMENVSIQVVGVQPRCGSRPTSPARATARTRSRLTPRRRAASAEMMSTVGVAPSPDCPRRLTTQSVKSLCWTVEFHVRRRTACLFAS